MNSLTVKTNISWEKKEGEYIRQLQPALNTIVAGRSRKEWTSENDEHTKEWKHQWYKAMEVKGLYVIYVICRKELIVQ